MSDPFDNILLNTDSYKVTHWRQFPPNTSHTYYYFESRGGVFPEVCFFGLQYIIKRHLLGQVVTEAKLEEAKSYFSSHFAQPIESIFNEAGWRYIIEKHGGKLPIRIKAVPEGKMITVKNVLLTIENTDPNCSWLPGYLETLLVQVWYPLTVATNSRAMKEILLRYMTDTADDTASTVFKMHDFGFRGCTSVEAAAIGGCAHLVNFMGTDTVASVVCARRFYSCPMAGFSIPAAEHSTVTSWTKERELTAYSEILKQWPSGLVAVVSDSYDLDTAIDHIWGEKLKAEVIARGEKGGVLVVRPDSGEPREIVVRVISSLGKSYGYSTNTKGFKVLPNYIRVIQGDGVDRVSLNECCSALKDAGWSIENIAFGSGGGLLQKLNRDTQKCAFKLSHIVTDGVEHAVFKCPKTDPGKMSKKGRFRLKEAADGSFCTIQEAPAGEDPDDVLQVVFEDGILIKDWTFEEIRKRAEVVTKN